MRAAASSPLLRVSSKWPAAARPLPAISPDRKMNWASACGKITFISDGKDAELLEKLTGGGQDWRSRGQESKGVH